MSETGLEDQLAELGLSEKEIDTYIAVLERGETTASELTETTGVSNRYVYEIIETLSDRGFVAVDDHVTPTKVRAREPESVVGRLTDEISAMESKLADRYADTESEVREFEVIKSQHTVLNRVREFLDHAEREIALAVPYEKFDAVIEELRAAVDRGVFVVVLVTDVAPGALDGSEFADVATVCRAWEHPAPTIVTTDRQYGLLAPSEMVLHAHTDQQTIALTQPDLVPVLYQTLIGNYWEVGEVVHVTDPRPIPATYESFQRAVLDATIRLQNGESVVGRLSVVPVQADDDPGTLEGTVVETRQGLVEPRTNTFSLESSLRVDRGDEVVSVGGLNTVFEDYEATAVEFTD